MDKCSSIISKLPNILSIFFKKNLVMEEINFFRDNLRYLRQLKGFNLVECGAQFDLGKSAISLYENGHSYPPLPIARRICRFFEVTMDEMFEKDIRPNPPPKLAPVVSADTEGTPKEGSKSGLSRGLLQPTAAAESPPALTKEEVQRMRHDMLQMMVKLEAVEMAGSNFDKQGV
jgi:transcriptional regulator with XRE-family HTH domain